MSLFVRMGDSTGQWGLAGDSIPVYSKVQGKTVYVRGDQAQAYIRRDIILYKEHTKNSNPHNKNKHQKGQARKQRDAGGEKGDARRKPNPNKRRQPNNAIVDQSYALAPVPGPGPDATLDPSRDNFAGLKNVIKAGGAALSGAAILAGLYIYLTTGNPAPLQQALAH